jgi:hypothetical protein
VLTDAREAPVKMQLLAGIGNVPLRQIGRPCAERTVADASLSD